MWKWVCDIKISPVNLSSQKKIISQVYQLVFTFTHEVILFLFDVITIEYENYIYGGPYFIILCTISCLSCLKCQKWGQI